jgi:hypothetical protein
MRFVDIAKGNRTLHGKLQARHEILRVLSRGLPGMGNVDPVAAP